MTDDPGRSIFSNEAFNAGLVLLTGACDIGHAPLVIVTHQSLHEMEKRRVTPDKIEETMQYYARRLPKKLLDDGLAVLVDFQTPIAVRPQQQNQRVSVNVNVKNAVELIMQALESLTREKKLAISTLYVLEPQSKDDAKLVKRRCGLSKSKPLFSFSFGKKKPDVGGNDVSKFKVVRIANEQELYLYVTKESLLTNFHGDAKFNLAEFLEFHRIWNELEELAASVLEPANSSGSANTLETRDEAMNKCDTLINQTRNGYWRSINANFPVYQSILEEFRILKVRLEHVKIEPHGLSSLTNDQIYEKFGRFSERLRAMLEEISKTCSVEALQALNIRKLEALRSQLETVATGDAQILIDEAGAFCHSVATTLPAAPTSVQNIEESGYATIKETRGASNLHERCDALNRLINDLKVEIDRSRKDLTLLYKYYRNLYRIIKWFGKVLDRTPLDPLRNSVSIQSQSAAGGARVSSPASESPNIGITVQVSAEIQKAINELCLRKPVPGDEMLLFAVDNLHILQTTRHKALTEFTVRRTYEMLELFGASIVSLALVESLINWRVLLLPGRPLTSKIQEDLQVDLQRFEWINEKRKVRFETEVSDLTQKYLAHIDLASPCDDSERSAACSLWKRMLFDVTGGPLTDPRSRFKQPHLPSISILTPVTETESQYNSTLNDNLTISAGPYADARALLESGSPSRANGQASPNRKETRFESKPTIIRDLAVENKMYAGAPNDSRHDDSNVDETVDVRNFGTLHAHNNSAGCFQLVSTTGEAINVTLSNEPDLSTTSSRWLPNGNSGSPASNKQLTTVYFSGSIPSAYHKNPGELFNLYADEANLRMIMESDIPDAIKPELLSALADSRLRLKKIGRIPISGAENPVAHTYNGSSQLGDERSARFASAVTVDDGDSKVAPRRPWMIESTAKIKIAKPAAQYADLYPDPAMTRPKSGKAKKPKLDINEQLPPKDAPLLDDCVDSALPRDQQMSDTEETPKLKHPAQKVHASKPSSAKHDGREDERGSSKTTEVSTSIATVPRDGDESALSEAQNGALKSTENGKQDDQAGTLDPKPEPMEHHDKRSVTPTNSPSEDLLEHRDEQIVPSNNLPVAETAPVTHPDELIVSPSKAPVAEAASVKNPDELNVPSTKVPATETTNGTGSTVKPAVPKKPFKVYEFPPKQTPIEDTNTTDANAPPAEMPVPTLRRGSLRGSRRKKTDDTAAAESQPVRAITPKGDQNKLNELFEARKVNLDVGLHPDDSGMRTESAGAGTGNYDWSQYYDLKVPIVIDNGSGFCKCGFADQQRPSAVFPSIVGDAKYEDVLVDRDHSIYVGEHAQRMRGVLKLSYPMEHGVVQDWSNMELIWKHAFFDQLRIFPDEHPVLLTEPPLNPLHNRERMLEVMFETFDVPATYIAIQGTLAMYDVGSLTGIALDSGDGCTHVVPIYEGFSLQNATHKQNLAGRDVTTYLKRLLLERGHSFTSTAEFEIVRDIKEKLSYCALDYEREIQLFECGASKLQTYRCPDGTEMQLGTELFRAPEYLFRPEVLQKDIPSIIDALLNCLNDCDNDLRKPLVSNIVLTGGNTLLRNFEVRLTEELRRCLPPGLAKAVRVVKPANSDECVWRGGASFARVASDNDMWISRDDYYDFGPEVVHRRCI